MKERERIVDARTIDIGRLWLTRSRRNDQSWRKAAGLMRHKRRALTSHLSNIRKEWSAE